VRRATSTSSSTARTPSAPSPTPSKGPRSTSTPPAPTFEEQLLDLCARTAARGVQVALLFWQGTSHTKGFVDHGQLPLFRDRGILARWDRPQPLPDSDLNPGCHHQKTFVIDGTRAFVGGMNMLQEYWDTPRHEFGEDRRVDYDIGDRDLAQRLAVGPDSIPLHDLFGAFEGDAVRDVEANFVERWNGAPSTWPNRSDAGDATDLPVPPDPGASTAAGGPRIQVVRTLAGNSYPGSIGEASIQKAALQTIGAAEESIYFENQYFYDEQIADALVAAAKRGVCVVGLITRRPDTGTFREIFEDLLAYRIADKLRWPFDPKVEERARLYTPVTNGKYPVKDIYVHSKTMVVDDRYVLHGSANFSPFSMTVHTEMDFLLDAPDLAKQLRLDLWSEHLCEQAPAEFEAGAKRFIELGQQNLEALQIQGELRSRVLPFLGQSVRTL
jgi:phosphatidylserine/phosphatidylglycerophosphate/cardiolipin synthase-like enzyme